MSFIESSIQGVVNDPLAPTIGSGRSCTWMVGRQTGKTTSVLNFIMNNPHIYGLFIVSAGGIVGDVQKRFRAQVKQYQIPSNGFQPGWMHGFEIMTVYSFKERVGYAMDPEIIITEDLSQNDMHTFNAASKNPHLVQTKLIHLR